MRNKRNKAKTAFTPEEAAMIQSMMDDLGQLFALTDQANQALRMAAAWGNDELRLEQSTLESGAMRGEFRVALRLNCRPYTDAVAVLV